jgi:hypothetical protein
MHGKVVGVARYCLGLDAKYAPKRDAIDGGVDYESKNGGACLATASLLLVT